MSIKSYKYIVLKTLIYRVLSIAGNTCFLYLLTGDLKSAGKFAVAVAIFHLVFYHVYEYLATKYEEKNIYKVTDET